MALSSKLSVRCTGRTHSHWTCWQLEGATAHVWPWQRRQTVCQKSLWSSTLPLKKWWLLLVHKDRRSAECSIAVSALTLRLLCASSEQCHQSKVCLACPPQTVKNRWKLSASTRPQFLVHIPNSDTVYFHVMMPLQLPTSTQANATPSSPHKLPISILSHLYLALSLFCAVSVLPCFYLALSFAIAVGGRLSRTGLFAGKQFTHHGETGCVNKGLESSWTRACAKWCRWCKSDCHWWASNHGAWLKWVHLWCWCRHSVHRHLCTLCCFHFAEKLINDCLEKESVNAQLPWQGLHSAGPWTLLADVVETFPKWSELFCW